MVRVCRHCIIIIIIALIGCVFFITPSKKIVLPNTDGLIVLEIADTNSGRVYASFHMEENSEFAIEFTHSVNNSPVREIFRIEGSMIKPAAVRFYSFGAGMLSDLDEGQIISRDGEALVITGFTQVYNELKFIIGTVSDHILFINGESISLRDLCGRNAHITIKQRG